MPTRIVAAVFSLDLPLLAVSGPLLRWPRRQQGEAGVTLGGAELFKPTLRIHEEGMS